MNETFRLDILNRGNFIGFLLACHLTNPDIDPGNDTADPKYRSDCVSPSYPHAGSTIWSAVGNDDGLA